MLSDEFANIEEKRVETTLSHQLPTHKDISQSSNYYLPWLFEKMDTVFELPSNLLDLTHVEEAALLNQLGGASGYPSELDPKRYKMEVLRGQDRYATKLGITIDVNEQDLKQALNDVSTMLTIEFAPQRTQDEEDMITPVYEDSSSSSVSPRQSRFTENYLEESISPTSSQSDVQRDSIDEPSTPSSTTTSDSGTLCTSEWSWPPPRRHVFKNMPRSIRSAFRSESDCSSSDDASLGSSFSKRAAFRRGIAKSSNLAYSIKIRLHNKDESDCIACMEPYLERNLRQLACGHKYCKSCLRSMVTSAMEQESTMPPKCCNTVLQPRLIKSVLPRADQLAFTKKVLEFDTPHDRRLFCTNQHCGKFIQNCKRNNTSDPTVAKCRKCLTKVCKICKNTAHAPGEDCPQDWELEVVLQMGDTEGWRRCYKCRSLVEITDGCNHMRCRCGAEFCYVCGSKWEFQCPQGCASDAHWLRRMEREQANARRERELENARETQEARLREQSNRIRRQQEEIERARRREQDEASERTRRDPILAKLREEHHIERESLETYQRDVEMKMKRRFYEERIDLLFAHSSTEQKREQETTTQKEAIAIQRAAAISEAKIKFEVVAETKVTELGPKDTPPSSPELKDSSMLNQAQRLQFMSELSDIEAKYERLSSVTEQSLKFQEKLYQYRFLEEREAMAKRHSAEFEIARRELLKRRTVIIEGQAAVITKAREDRALETGLRYITEEELMQ